MIEYQDRVAIITGSGRGLGASHAKLLAARGAAVVVNDPGVATDGTGTESRPADDVVAEIRAAGGAAIADYHSVADPEGGAAIVQAALDEFGRIDVVVNNAGILRDKAFHNLEWPNLHAVLDVHLKGAFYVTQPAFRIMREQNYGRILVTASNAGILGNFGQTNYGAAKMGLVGFTNVLAVEGAKFNIKANAIAPLAYTRMTEDLLGALGEKLQPELVSPLVTYLSHESCESTGRTYSVGGGRVAEVFIAECQGYTSDSLTPESLRDNWNIVTDQTGYEVPATIADETAMFLKALK